MIVPLDVSFKQRNVTRLLTILFGFFAFLLLRGSAKACLCLGALLTLMFKNPKRVYALAKTGYRDSIALVRFVRMNIKLAVLNRRGWTVARNFQHLLEQHPDKACLVMVSGATMTFRDVEELSNRVGAYFRAMGYQRGDCVALLMDNRPEYVCFWLGLSKIGVYSALINTNLRRETLLHSIKVAHAKGIIVGTELIDALKEIRSAEELQSLPVYQFSEENQRDNDNFRLLADTVDLGKALREQAPEDLSAHISAGKPTDKIMYVYTSGTTGMPKAAVITNSRYIFMSSATFVMLAMHQDEVVYNPLPLYHTAGGIVGVGNAIVQGATVVLRQKFSASNFWKDCITYDCTAAQYIGELCRYLLSTPHKKEETQHRLRLMYGNGLRPQIWAQFVTRFNIPHIGEVYGSTEGNSNLANVTNHMGAMGFIPIIGRSFYPVQVVRCDDESGEPLRNAQGHCIRCEPGETGLLVGKVDARRATTAFSGYADKEATEKKLLRNVFSKGDLYFNSGDMAVGDFLGYFYFKDRTGDTFRWRGENVATLEVEAIITNVVGLKDCVVFGVEVPHVEGKAGMAVIVDPERNVDFEHLSAAIRGSLPPYARPLFIRLTDEIPSTSTYKMQKRDLVAESFHIQQFKDPVYYLNRDGLYRPLTAQQYGELLQGAAGL